MLAKQSQKIERLKGKVDWVITDSPVLLSSIYANDSYPQCFHDTVLWVWRQYCNFTFFIDRSGDYQDWGRVETKEQSEEVDRKILKYLESNNIPFNRFKAEPDIHLKMVAMVEKASNCI